MNILTATADTQGQRRNDFNWMTEGEPVYLGMTCDGATADDSCGCARAWSGMDSRKAGTTAKVIDDPDMTPEKFRAAYAASLDAAGWGLDPADAAAMADEMIHIAAAFRPGMIVEHRNTRVAQRRPR
jgi:hypothetical protein